MEKKASNFSGQIGFVLRRPEARWVWAICGDSLIWRPRMAAVVRQGCDSFGKIRVSYDAGALKSASSSIQLDCLVPTGAVSPELQVEFVLAGSEYPESQVHRNPYPARYSWTVFLPTRATCLGERTAFLLARAECLESLTAFLPARSEYPASQELRNLYIEAGWFRGCG